MTTIVRAEPVEAVFSSRLLGVPAPVGRGLPGGNSLFFVSPKKSKQKKGDPMVRVPPLRYGQPAVLAENGAGLELASLRQSPDLIRFRLRSSARPDGWGRKTNIQNPSPNSNPECRKRKALPARESQAAAMFARERSTRGQMKSPSIAQRGEGGVRGGSGELEVLSQAHGRRSVTFGRRQVAWPNWSRFYSQRARISAGIGKARIASGLSVRRPAKMRTSSHSMISSLPRMMR